MTAPNLLHRRPVAICEVKVEGVCQWTETSDGPFVVARGELQRLSFHPSTKIVSNDDWDSKSQWLTFALK